jgi:hypothetical protein
MIESMNREALRSTDDDWVEIVPAMAFIEADSRFAQWLRERGIQRLAIAENDLRIDTVRTDEGSGRRYRIRRVTLSDLEMNQLDDREGET